MNFSVEDRGQGLLVYVQEFCVWRQATPSECAQALSDAIEAEREACALVADAMAGDLADRMTDADWKEDITGDQVVNGYRMIGKLIRNRK